MKFNAIYYVKGGKLGYWVYAHYPTTEPDTPYMLFKFKENAEMFCGALNAENNYVPYSLYLGKGVK